MLIHVDSLFKSIYINSFQTFSESRYCKGSKPHSAWSACLKAIMAGFGPAFNNGKPASSVSSVRVEAWHKMAQEFVGWAPSALYNQNISDLFRTWRVLVCRCNSSYHWSSWAFDARGIIGGDGRVMEILIKKRNCAFDLKRLSALIALVQDHLKSGVQQACWGINDTNNEGMWGFIKNPVLSITSSGEIGFWEHDIEASKMQGRARGRKGERKTYHINPYHHITMEFGGYLLNVAKNPTRARPRKGEAQGVLSYQKATGIFDNPHVLLFAKYPLYYWMIVRVFSVHSAQSAHRIRVCAHRVVVMRRLSIFCVILLGYVTCLLQMWKVLEHKPYKRKDKRLDSAQRCCK